MLADPETAPISAGLRATLAFLRKMTAEPGALTPEDARAVLAAGVSEAALRDAIEVAYLFNVYTRLADAMGWEVAPEGHGIWLASAKTLLTRGYAM